MSTKAKTGVLTICLNPVVQKTLLFDKIRQGDVNRTELHFFDASGKGVNVSRVLQQSGAANVHLTHLGGRFKDFFLKMCAKDQLRVEYCPSDTEIRFCYTLLESECQQTTELVEEAQRVGIELESKIKEKYLALLDEVDVITISGSKAEGYSESLFSWMTLMARERDKKVILDFRGKDLLYCLPARPHIIKPNYQEFCRTFFPEEKLDSSSLKRKVKDKMEELHRQFGIETVLTYGAKEILAYGEGRFFSLLPDKLNVKNTIGCGDAFTAGLALACLDNIDFEKALELGKKLSEMNAVHLRPGSIK